MDSTFANFFIIPIGFGSAILFAISSYNSNGQFSPFTDNIIYNNPITYFLVFCLIYFVVDFQLMISRYRPKYNIYFFHHFICIVSILIVQLLHFDFVKYVLAYLTYEISTPFLNFAIRNRKLGIFNFFSKLNNYLFFLTYTIFRVCFGTILMIKIIPLIYALNFPIKCLVIFPIALQSIIYWWYYRIIRILFN